MTSFSRFALAGCIIVVCSLQARAQEQPVEPSAASTDSLLTVLPARSIAEISASIETTKKRLGQTEARRLTAQALVSYTDSRIELKKKEIDLIDTKIDVADKAKRESEVISLKAEMRVAEQLLDILQRQMKVRTAEMDAAAAEIDDAGAKQMALELELELAKRRAERSAATANGGAAPVSLVQMISDLESRTLDAQLAAAKTAQGCADKARDLASERVKLHELQKNFSMGVK